MDKVTGEMTSNKFNAVLLFGCMLILSGVLLSGCGSGEEEENGNPLSEEEQESVEVRPEVIFAVADDRPIFSYVESSGVVDANREVRIIPRISGYIEQTMLVEGRYVQQGDTLIQFVDEELEYQLEQAENAYKQALSEYQLEGTSQSMIESFTDTTEYQLRDDELVRIYSGLAQAELDLKSAQLNYSYATITAPFSGVLALEERVEPGSYVTSGTELGMLIDDRTVEVRFDVLEQELGRISSGMTVELTAPNGTNLEGRVVAVSPRVDSESKTGEVIVAADNGSGALRTGMTVEGRIQVERMTDKVRIPRSAILSRDGGRTLVFKYNPGTEEVEWVYVEPTVQNREWSLIDHPDIEPGDTLAVDQHFALSHLQKVTPKMQFLQQEETDMELGQ